MVFIALTFHFCCRQAGVLCACAAHRGHFSLDTSANRLPVARMAFHLGGVLQHERQAVSVAHSACWQGEGLQLSHGSPPGWWAQAKGWRALEGRNPALGGPMDGAMLHLVSAPTVLAGAAPRTSPHPESAAQSTGIWRLGLGASHRTTGAQSPGLLPRRRPSWTFPGLPRKRLSLNHSCRNVTASPKHMQAVD